jgi:hypothetical protein
VVTKAVKVPQTLAHLHYRSVQMGRQASLDGVLDAFSASNCPQGCGAAFGYGRAGCASRLELGIHPHELSNPWHASFASMPAFIVGGVIPLAAILLTPRDIAVPVTAVAVLVALDEVMLIGDAREGGTSINGQHGI